MFQNDKESDTGLFSKYDGESITDSNGKSMQNKIPSMPTFHRLCPVGFCLWQMFFVHPFSIDAIKIKEKEMTVCIQKLV